MRQVGERRVFSVEDVTARLARMFEDLGGTLPLPTRIAMGLSQLLTGIGGILVAAAMIGAFHGKGKG